MKELDFEISNGHYALVVTATDQCPKPALRLTSSTTVMTNTHIYIYRITHIEILPHAFCILSRIAFVCVPALIWLSPPVPSLGVGERPGYKRRDTHFSQSLRGTFWSYWRSARASGVDAPSQGWRLRAQRQSGVQHHRWRFPKFVSDWFAVVTVNCYEILYYHLKRLWTSWEHYSYCEGHRLVTLPGNVSKMSLRHCNLTIK